MLKKFLFAMAAIILIAQLVNAQVPQLINYQGILVDPATGQTVPDDTYSITFSIYDVASGGSALWTETQNVETEDGLYSVLLGSMTPWIEGALKGPEKYLGIKVGTDPELTPRKPITSAAYAILCNDANSLRSLSPAAFADSAHNHNDNYYTKWELNFSDGTPPNQGSNRVSWDNIKDMPEGFVDGVDNGGDGDGWSLTGNSGTTPGTNFLGTTDDKALELKVNNARALRLEPITGYTSHNIIGGTSNYVTPGVYGATIGGGGDDALPNRVTDNFGTVSGGQDNMAGDAVGSTTERTHATVSGGFSNRAIGSYSCIGGGYLNRTNGNYAVVSGGDNNRASGNEASVTGGRNNTASQECATVGGGMNNNASGNYATVSGGYLNTANGSSSATVGGGYLNIASGLAATIPGGYYNSALGNYSFAAGSYAKAWHEGSFVWGDASSDSIFSEGDNQFIVCASGGIWFGTTSLPDLSDGFINTSTGAYLSNGGTWTNASDKALKRNFEHVNGRQILNRLANLPIHTWSYKSEQASIRHIGPVAQDFHTAFDVGGDERHISTVDADGVALVAIKGLYELLKERDAQIATQQEQIQELQQRFEELLIKVRVLQQDK